jgi:hypothetical protein
VLPFYEFLAIGLMVTFILALFTGYPVAWLLGILSLGLPPWASFWVTSSVSTPS